MKKKILLTGLAVFFSGFLLFVHSENLIYAGSYNMKGLMTQLAQITIQSNSVKTSTKTFNHFAITAATFSKWDSFFKMRDLYESYVDPVTMKPSLYKRNISEGNYTKTEKYIFNSSGTIQSSVSVKGRRPVSQTFRVGAATTDVVTMFFKLRKINFERYSSGQMIPFVVVFDQKEYPVSIKYMGKEVVKNAGNLGTKTCYKLSISAKTNALRGSDKNLIWLTADASRIPVLVRFSIPVGVGQITLSSAH